MTDVAPSSTPAAVPAVGVDNNTYRAARAANAQAIRQAGQDPFGPVGKRFVPTHSVQQARAMAPTDPAGRSDLVMVAGRIGNLRMSGAKLVFGSLFDRSRAEAYQRQKAEGFPDVDGAEAKKERGIQLFLEAGALAACWPVVQALDLADWVGITGRVGRTRRGEITVFAESLVVLGKAHLPPPHQAGADAGHLAAETRARQRYVDLMMSDSSLSTFVMRSRIVSEIRRFFTDRGYLEVETPMMQPIPGGASARPFTTHHNALGLDLYLRIAPELYLKRLIVGGMDRVFELNRNFRNEGISPRHNPEFTMIEWYEAYADHHVMMELSETLFRTLADKLLGTRVLNWNGMRLDLDQPWRRITYHDAMRDIGGIAYEDEASVLAKARELGLTLDEFPTYDRLANAVWEEIVEPHLIQPTFITDQPTWLTPLCRTQPDNPGRSLRFELFMARMEVGNAYTELNDPDIQRARFSEQVAEAAAAGDDEAGVVAGMVDHDFCTALDHGLPACGGQGIGIDRLVMLLTGQTNIRDVILFPTMRPHASKTTETAHP